MENENVKVDEDESTQNYNLWFNHKITDQQYFKLINNSK